MSNLVHQEVGIIQIEIDTTIEDHQGKSEVVASATNLIHLEETELPISHQDFLDGTHWVTSKESNVFLRQRSCTLRKVILKMQIYRAIVTKDSWQKIKLFRWNNI